MEYSGINRAMQVFPHMLAVFRHLVLEQVTWLFCLHHLGIRSTPAYASTDVTAHLISVLPVRSIVIDRKHFIKYWPVWFEHCGYMWHICLPNASQSHVIRPIGWFNIVYQARHHVSLKRFHWKCHAENVFKNVLAHTIWSVYGWIP